MKPDEIVLRREGWGSKGRMIEGVNVTFINVL
jgi:hypothetical protein